VQEDGWIAEAAFVNDLLSKIKSAQADHQISVLWFNKHAHCIKKDGSCLENVAAPFTADADSLIAAVAGVKYHEIREGSTDHPQVYMTARDAFLKGRENHDKVLVLVTDGETHHGQNCGSYTLSNMEAKIGKCENSHPCMGRGCLVEKCMCGQYTAALFKDYGYSLKVVGIANQHHVGVTEAGIFDKQMTAMATPNDFFAAADFSDLGDGAVGGRVVQSMCTTTGGPPPPSPPTPPTTTTTTGCVSAGWGSGECVAKPKIVEGTIQGTQAACEQKCLAQSTTGCCYWKPKDMMCKFFPGATGDGAGAAGRYQTMIKC